MWNNDLWHEMDRLRREVNTIFSNYGRVNGSATYPLVNVYEDKDKFTITAELPGVKKENVNITYTDANLTISGKQDALEIAKNMEPVRQERSVGSFEKTLRIPTRIMPEKISATFTNGILAIVLPKTEEAKPKTITIEG